MSIDNELKTANRELLQAGEIKEAVVSLKENVDNGVFLEQKTALGQYAEINSYKSLKNHLLGADIGEDVNGPDHSLAMKDADDYLNKTSKAFSNSQYDMLMLMGKRSKDPESVVHDHAIYFKDEMETDRDNVRMFELKMSIKELHKDLGLDNDSVRFSFKGDKMDIGVEQTGKMGILLSSKELEKKGISMDDFRDIAESHMEIFAMKNNLTSDGMNKLPVYQREVDGYDAKMDMDSWAELSTKKKDKVYDAFGMKEERENKMKKFNSMKLTSGPGF